MAVFGTDDRYAIADTTSAPYNMVVKVEADFDGDGYADALASGIMISPNHVLTATHAISGAESVQISPGYGDGKAPFGSYTSASVDWRSEFYDSDAVADGHTRRSYDIGIVTLSEDLGTEIGFMPVQINTTDSVKGLSVSTAGYPGDIGSGVDMYGADGQIASDAALSEYANFMGYNGTLDSHGGQSGSGVWQMIDGSPVLVGVHVAGGVTHNGGVVITPEVYDWIYDWTGGQVVLSDASDFGSNGADAIAGTDGADTVSGLGGADTLGGGSGADLIYGNLGLDLMRGGSGADTLFGGQNDGPANGDGHYRSGADTLSGGAGGDVLYGNFGGDILYGGQDADTIFGGGSSDTLFGNLGNDLIYGGTASSDSSADTIYGGDGDDTFVMLEAYSGQNVSGTADALQFTGGDLLIDVEYIQFLDQYIATSSLI